MLYSDGVVPFFIPLFISKSVKKHRIRIGLKKKRKHEYDIRGKKIDLKYTGAIVTMGQRLLYISNRY